MIEQTRFLSTVFLCSEFKLEHIYAGVNGGKNVCDNFCLRELISADCGEQIVKIRTLKNFMPHGSFQDIAQRTGCNEVVSYNQLT